MYVLCPFQATPSPPAVSYWGVDMKRCTHIFMEQEHQQLFIHSLSSPEDFLFKDHTISYHIFVKVF